MLKRYPLSFVLVAVIWVLCLIPVPDTPLSKFSLIDKWTHFVMYGVFSFVVCFECKGISWKTILLPILMGILIELAQNYLTTCRSGELADGVANSIGVMLGNGLFWIYRKIRR